MNSMSEFTLTEEVDGHRWGTFKASKYFGAGQWEYCFNCGMIRRRDKKNNPCRGLVRVSPRKPTSPQQ